VFLLRPTGCSVEVYFELKSADARPVKFVLSIRCNKAYVHYSKMALEPGVFLSQLESKPVGMIDYRSTVLTA
jgi:hypothetical protein